MSKIVFTKYLPPVRPKMVPKLKMLKIYCNLAHSILMSKIIFIKYLPPGRLNIVPNLKCTGFIEVWRI